MIHRNLTSAYCAYLTCRTNRFIPLPVDHSSIGSFVVKYIAKFANERSVCLSVLPFKQMNQFCCKLTNGPTMYQVRGIIADPLGRVAFLVNFKFLLGILSFVWLHLPSDTETSCNSTIRCLQEDASRCGGCAKLHNRFVVVITSLLVTTVELIYYVRAHCA